MPAGHRRLYLAQSDAYRRHWLNQRGSGDCRLTSKQNAELKTWFEFWDRDCEGEVDPRTISDALFALKVLNELQKEEFDALVEAATDGDERRRFSYAEFRTLMTYPKCGIAKRILSVMSGQDFVKGMPFHIVVQAYNREKLIGGLMSKVACRRTDAEKKLKNVESKLLRKQRQRDAEKRTSEEGNKSTAAAKSGMSPPAASEPARPTRVHLEPTNSNVGDRPIHRMHSSAVVLHSKTLFKPTIPKEVKRMQFRPSDFFPREVSGTFLSGVNSGRSRQPFNSNFADTAPISLQKHNKLFTSTPGNFQSSKGSMGSTSSDWGAMTANPYNNSFADTAPISSQHNNAGNDDLFGSATGWAVESFSRPAREPLETR